MAADLLYEIGVEEIPADMVLPALEQLEQALGQGLERLRLGHGKICTYGTPRRLAVLVEGVDERQEDVVEEIKGPPAQAAFDADGNPIQAARGFAQSRGVELAALEVRRTDKGEFVFARVSQPGKAAAEVLPDLLKAATENLTFRKTMCWAEPGFRFARPLRWVVALLAGEVLDLTIAGVRGGRVTRGHRMLGGSSIEIATPDKYLELLEANGVIADHRRRREAIVAQATELAAAQGYRPRIDPEVLTEVNFLVEYPVCIMGGFSAEYLKVPEEVVVTVLQGHQKALPVEDESGNLVPHFIAVTNADPEAADTVRRGWEKVIVPRLDDGQFYYEQDVRTPLPERRDELKRVTFMGKLGSLHDKTERLVALVGWLAEQLADITEQDARAARRAAELAKCDQVTMMVRDGKLGEALEGIIGGYYARACGESAEVATALAEQYQPRQPGDPVPVSPAGRLLSLADKIDNLAAAFCLGQVPTGSADPYALRRQTAAIIEIATQSDYHFPLSGLIERALELLPEPEQTGGVLSAGEAADELKAFFAERLQAAWEQRGIGYDICRAVLTAPWDEIADAAARADFLASLRESQPEAFAELANAAERPARIARPEAIPDVAEVDAGLFQHPTETRLAEEFAAVQEQVEAIMTDESPDFGRAAELMAALLPTIHQYFEDVMVMVEDEALCRNRLTLLRRIDELFLRLADFLEIVPAAE